MAGIQLSGLVSGLDTKTIVSQLMSIEKQPRTRIQLQQTAVQARQTGLRDIASKLNALKLAAHDLGSTGLWADTQAITTSDATKVSVRATAGVGPGGYDIAVTQLAASSRRTYSFTEPTAADTPLTVTKKDGTTTTFLLQPGAKLDDAVAQINARPDAGVFAVNVEGKLVLASRTTGKDSTFTAGGAAALDPGTAVDGVDAQYSVNGKPAPDSPTNVVANGIPGVELTLKAKTASVTVNVGGPTPDTAAVKDKLKAFVAAYNDAVTTMRNGVSEKRVPNAASAVDASKGALFGDTGVSEILSTLRTAISDDVPGFAGSGLKALAALGISTGSAGSGTTLNQDAVAGKLTFDEATFDQALQKDPVGVRTLLGGVTGTDGFSQSFENRVKGWSQTGGLLDARISAAGDEVTRIQASLARFDLRMESRQSYFERQFTALETAMSKSQNLQSQLTARLGTTSTA